MTYENKIQPISPSEIDSMLVGTLLFNKKLEIIYVKSLSYSGAQEITEKSSNLKFEINGLPLEEFKSLPVTVKLLRALGWSIDEKSMQHVIIAMPQKKHTRHADPSEFPVYFLMADQAIEGYGEGEILIRNTGGDLAYVDDFHSLDFYYLEHYRFRMSLKFVTTDYDIAE